MSLAVVIISSAKRLNLLSTIVESVAAQNPDELLVVSDCIEDAGFPFFTVAPITRTTIDALIKRDAGWAATTSDAVLFLCDDHRLDPHLLDVYRTKYEPRNDWDILCPQRYTVRGHAIIPLNVGQAEGYVGGHAGIYRRRCAQLLPFTAGPHDLNWDVGHTHQLVAKGARLVYADQDLSVEDIEPGAEPWR
jgi:hypothetical protein